MKTKRREPTIEEFWKSNMPLVFGSNGAIGKECATFHKILATKIADNQLSGPGLEPNFRFL